jgi:outer membrane protein, multidrug efflux system
VGPDYHRPELSVPSEFRGRTPDAPAAAGQSLGDVAWWQIFQDETLQTLIRTALAENYDIRIAAARIIQARAQVTYTRSFQAPDLSGSASAPYQRILGDRSPLQFKESFSPFGSFAGRPRHPEATFWLPNPRRGSS